ANSLGFYTSLLRLRGNVSNEPWTEFNNLQSFGEFHTYKLQVNGENWDLYVDGVYNQSKPKSSGLLIDNIGNAYTQTLSFWLRNQVKIKTGLNEYIYKNFDGYDANIDRQADIAIPASQSFSYV